MFHKNLKILPKIYSWGISKKHAIQSGFFTPQQACHEISSKASFKTHASEKFHLVKEQAKQLWKWDSAVVKFKQMETHTELHMATHEVSDGN
jgi:hypothetical protein